LWTIILQCHPTKGIIIRGRQLLYIGCAEGSFPLPGSSISPYGFNIPDKRKVRRRKEGQKEVVPLSHWVQNNFKG
jgi:hypothetical protein